MITLCPAVLNSVVCVAFCVRDEATAQNECHHHQQQHQEQCCSGAAVEE